MMERWGRMELLQVIKTDLLWTLVFPPTVRIKLFDLDWRILNILKTRFPPLHLDGTLKKSPFCKSACVHSNTNRANQQKN